MYVMHVLHAMEVCYT